MAVIPPRRFEPPDHWERDPELGRRVEALMDEGRYRTAMDEVLRRLRRDPASTDALHLALALFGAARTSRVASPEPFTPIQEVSALLAPIVTACSVCGVHWHSRHLFSPGREIVAANPMGLQCQECRHTECRHCRGLRYLTDLRGPCPQPGCSGTLTTPVLPTGRADVEPTDPTTIEGVVVVRDGPVRPTMGEAMTVVTKFVPLLPDDVSTVLVERSAPGAMRDEFSRRDLALSAVVRLEGERALEPRAWERARTVFVQAGATDDADYLVTVVRWPGSFRAAPLVHVQVMREGSERMDAQYVERLLRVMVPRAFTDGPTIGGGAVGTWPDDPRGLMLAIVAEEHDEYLLPPFDLRVHTGRDEGGARWALATVVREG